MTTGASVLARMLDGYGVTHIFQVPAVLRRTMVELEYQTQIKRIRAHSEKSAAYMADGYARAAQRPGVCMAQVIGALNLAAGLRDAHLAHSPVLAFTGGRDPSTKFRKVYQEVDDVPAFESVTKFNATVDDVDRIPDMVRQAFRVATTGSPGPVHLQFRGNEGQVDAEETQVEPMVDSAFATIPPHRLMPADDEKLRAAIELLRTAERPVLVAGGGVKWSQAGPALVALAEHLQIPVSTSLNGKDMIPADHPLAVGVVGTYSRASANRVVAEADLVCFIGTETGGMTTHFWQVPRFDTDTIHIDIDAESIGRNYTPLVGIQGDARSVLNAMLTLAGARRASSSWTERAADAVREWRSEHANEFGSDQVPIRPERLCVELSKNTPDNGIVVVDTGHAGMWMGGIFDNRAGQSYLRSAGHLGWAFPAALGAKCGAPDRPVVCFTGDSGFWYHIAEIETAVRWNICAVIVVNNNSGGNQSKRGFDRAYGGTQTEQGAREIWKFTEVNFAAIATQIGALGIRVEKPGDLAGALERGFSSGRPTVIDVVTDIDALAPLAVTS
ncbi:thiamine pyrophosphate-binding protein [uncultured Ilumatobacter sp.]|jgi:acetolactate synthase-1/2/3 large subunit|uniref:thiamine pyrophosphate-binding protein n=1 Tax=uncultured Ilumatobacter sp. TaxID=879968 RepID=UPI00374E48FB|tara:strand:- start:1976 stop:3646 length:1671 start_codon:yes stop_codon:yes gene_type:complete